MFDLMISIIKKNKDYYLYLFFFFFFLVLKLTFPIAIHTQFVGSLKNIFTLK